MKKLFPFMALVFMLAAGCKKSENSGSSSDNSWVLAGVTYKTAITNKGVTSGASPMTLINFWDAAPTSDLKVNAVSISFKESPTSSGTYQLVGVGAATTAKQFELAAGTHTATYAYIGTAVDVTVTVEGGKVKVVIPEVTLKATTSIPDAKLSGTVKEL